MRLGSGIGLVVFIASLIILWKIREIILLMFTAVVFATAINQLVKQLQRLHIRRGLAIVLSMGGLLILLAGLLIVIIPPFIDQFEQLIDTIPIGIERLESWSLWLQDIIPEQVLEEIRDTGEIIQRVQVIASRLIDNFFSLFSSSLSIILKLLLVLVLIIMLLANPKPYRQGFVLLFPSFYRRRIDEILQKCEVALGGWVRGILFNMTVITLMSGIGLWVLQVPLPFVNAILAGILTFIPNLGPTLSVIPPVALALLDTPWKAGAVVILYILIQQLESNILTPIVMERQVSLLPAVTLISQLIFASFFGFLGLFLALPIVVVAQVWLKEVLIEDVMNHWQRPKSNHREKIVQ
ncbi:MAG: AI-2E family transporter [Elainellaceae cyanobacterium]